MQGVCRFCGNAGEGESFTEWVRDTFTNHDLLVPGEIVCNICSFWFEQRSTELQQRMGKDKPQKMQNYSHFVVGGEWKPVSKGNKPEMRRLLTNVPFPELAAIAVSGQKHVAFRARRNSPGQAAGWVQFEEQSVWVDQTQLTGLLDVVEALYQGFSKEEIERGEYFPNRIMTFGIEKWQELEEQLRPERGRVIFALALFLAQRSDDGTGDQEAGSGPAESNLERGAGRLQAPVPDEHLGAVSEPGSGSGLYRQPGEVRQLSLFEPGS
jgi:hypothetical protein